MTGHPLRPVTRRRLGRPLPYQLPDGTQTAPSAPFGLYSPESMSVYPQFPMAIQLRGARSYALLTRPPLYSSPPKLQTVPLDLHVLGTPPAFTLSQDQTLQADLFGSNPSFVSFRVAAILISMTGLNPAFQFLPHYLPFVKTLFSFALNRISYFTILPPLSHQQVPFYYSLC